MQSTPFNRPGNRLGTHQHALSVDHMSLILANDGSSQEIFNHFQLSVETVMKYFEGRSVEMCADICSTLCSSAIAKATEQGEIENFTALFNLTPDVRRQYEEDDWFQDQLSKITGPVPSAVSQSISSLEQSKRAKDVLPVLHDDARSVSPVEETTHTKDALPSLQDSRTLFKEIRDHNNIQPLLKKQQLYHWKRFHEKVCGKQPTEKRRFLIACALHNIQDNFLLGLVVSKLLYSNELLKISQAEYKG